MGLDAIGERLNRCRDHLIRRANRLISPELRLSVGASDLVQETYVDAARKLGSMPEANSDALRAWLYRIMVLNLAEKRRELGAAKRDVHRVIGLEETPADGVGPRLLERLADGGESPSTEAAKSEDEARLAEAIALLPDVERQAVIWRYWERLDYAEIGRRLGGRSADAARMIHVRARHRMFLTLEDPPS